MAVQLTDGSNNNLIDATSKGVVVQNPRVAVQAGFTGLAGINDLGTVVTGGRVNPVYVTEGNGLYAASKNLLWDDTFNSTSQNTAKYKYANTTMAAAQTGGALSLNSGSITTVSTSVGYQSWKTFPLSGKSELVFNFSAQVPNGAQANQTIEFGAFQATLNGAAPGAPTDGVLFRFNPAGELRGIVNYAGVETQTVAITPPSTSANHDWQIVVQTNTVLFYIDGILRGLVALLTDAPTLGQPFSAGAMPLTFRVFTAGSAPAQPPKLLVTDVFVSSLGPDLARSWATQKAGFGHMASQGQNGSTMGSTSNLGQTGYAAATALLNTNVGTGNPAGLGGYAHYLPTLTAGTDGILTSFQNPVGSTTVTPRNLIITGVWVDSVVDSPLTGGPLAMVYILAYGHTSISLATTESASFTSGTTKGPRRVMLGVEGCAATALAGTTLSPAGVYREFVSPIVVAPGEFVAVAARNVGTVTTLGSVVATVGFDAYWE